MKALVSLPYGLAFRNVVTCGVLETLTGLGVECEVRLPHLVEEDLAVLLPQLPAGTRTAPLYPVAHSRVYSALKMLKQHRYGERTRLAGFQLRRERRRAERPAFHAVASTVEGLSRLVLPEAAVDGLLARVAQPHVAAYRRELTASRPDVIVVTKPGYHPDELPLIVLARRLGIPTIAVDTTWDNMASKRPPYVRTDALTVWNERMAHEATAYYQYQPRDVAIAGGPQFDVLFRPSAVSRAQLCARLGIDAAEAIVLVTLNNPTLTPGVPAQIQMLADLRDAGAFGGRPNLVFRLHPWDRDQSGYRDALQGRTRTSVERPFATSGRQSVYESLPRPDDVAHYGALLQHSDVLVNVASTTSLDAIAVDCPVVNIAFDTVPVAPESSIANYYGYAHYKPIVDTGAVDVAYSREALGDALRDALRHRGARAEARAAARHQFLHFEDGQSYRRIADRVLQSLRGLDASA
jgi:hypothetical protein